MSEEKLTPLMQQYFGIREQYPDAVLFFQVGDFYELFFDDARTVSAFLAITLTKRGKSKGEDIPLCGIPVHALNHYLIKLVKGGFKVAICDQVTKPVPGTVVERKVTRVLTPGTLTDSSMLDEKSASYLFTFFPGETEWGLVFTELLAAQLFATTIPAGSFRMLEAELIRFFPDEIILPHINRVQSLSTYFKQQGYVVSYAHGSGAASTDDPHQAATVWIEHQFGGSVIKKLYENPSLESTFQTLYHYLKRNNEESLAHLKSVQFYQPEDYLILDGSTQRNLELVKNSQDGSRKNSLFSVLDKACTPMGSRTIKKWLLRPLVQPKGIIQRQEVIGHFISMTGLLDRLQELLNGISDLERMIGRIALRRTVATEYLALKNSLLLIPALKELLLGTGHHLLLIKLIADKLFDFTPLVDLLDTALEDEPNSRWIIKRGFDFELDRLRVLVEQGQEAMLAMEREEIARTGIGSLKIRYTDVFGYSLEVTKANMDAVPADYIIQQTLSNRTRFITPRLKELEQEIARANNDIESVQAAVYDRVRDAVETELAGLRQLAQSVAYLDALFGLARVAYDNGYVKPTFNEHRDIIISQGRHPVIEQRLGQAFVANDTSLTDDESLWIITGPNMGGKSTYLRQVALLSIMAQIGSFIPAHSASLSILDRIFTRIGSGDNLAEGKSTFLVEMEEAAVICTQSTKHSLVILDEVGRGTSTFDGMAIAQSIIEYIFTTINARCLFATHYHELTHLAQTFNGIANFHMVCRKSDGLVLFLHQLARGTAPGSFGLEVAKLAQLPAEVIDRAAVILKSLEQGEAYAVVPATTLGAFQPASDSRELSKLKEQLVCHEKTLAELKNVDIEALSPRQAFDLIWKLKAEL